MDSAFCHLQEQHQFESKAAWEVQSASKAQWMAQRKEQQVAAAQAEAELVRHRREIAQKLADDRAREIEDIIKQQVYSQDIMSSHRQLQSLPFDKPQHSRLYLLLSLRTSALATNRAAAANMTHRLACELYFALMMHERFSR